MAKIMLLPNLCFLHLLNHNYTIFSLFRTNSTNISFSSSFYCMKKISRTGLLNTLYIYIYIYIFIYISTSQETTLCDIWIRYTSLDNKSNDSLNKTVFHQLKVQPLSASENICYLRIIRIMCQP